MDTPDQPDRKVPKRLIVRAVLRAILSAVVLVTLYYLLPLDRPLDGNTLARLVVGLFIFAGIAVWQIRTIVGSPYPAIRAFEALGVIVPLYLVLFASTYFVVERASAANFSEPLTRTDALYFTVTIFTTVGFGDIAARSQPARIAVTVQMLVNLLLLGAGARILLRAVNRGHERNPVRMAQTADQTFDFGPKPQACRPRQRRQNSRRCAASSRTAAICHLVLSEPRWSRSEE